MNDTKGREVVYFDKNKNIAIIKDSVPNSFLIVSDLSLIGSDLFFRELVRYCKTLEYAISFVKYEFIEVGY